MTYDFDRRIGRQHAESLKWGCYDEDVLPVDSWLPAFTAMKGETL